MADQTTAVSSIRAATRLTTVRLPCPEFETLLVITRLWLSSSATSRRTAEGSRARTRVGTFRPRTREVRQILSKFDHVTSLHGHVHQTIYNKIGNMSSAGGISTSWPWPYPPVRKSRRDTRCATTLTWQSAQETAQAVNKGGKSLYSDWRVPQVTELAGIAERQSRNPRINLVVFPDTPAEPLWTVSSRRTPGSEAFAFVLSFGADGVKYENKEEKHELRLVRSAP